MLTTHQTAAIDRWYRRQQPMFETSDAAEMAMGTEDYAIPRPQPTKTIWVTKDGQRIPVREMSDGHLINTIRMLRRKAAPMLMAELSSMDRYIAGAPDGAAMACEGEANRLIEMTDDEYISSRVITFDAMLAEAEKRGLQL